MTEKSQEFNLEHSAAKASEEHSSDGAFKKQTKQSKTPMHTKQSCDIRKMFFTASKQSSGRKQGFYIWFLQSR